MSLRRFSWSARVCRILLSDSFFPSDGICTHGSFFFKHFFSPPMCSLGYLAPDKIDNKFFDPKHAFKEVDVQAKTVKELVPVKKPKVGFCGGGILTIWSI